MELHDKLRAKRKEHKKTQKDIADFLGITESGYGYYEQGRNKPSLETLEKLSGLYGLNMDYWSSIESSEGYFAFSDGGDGWTEEEMEYARAAVEALRKLRGKEKK